MPLPKRFQPDLPCGCSRCGCLCEQHSPDGKPWPCIAHNFTRVLRRGFGEAAELVSLGLFLACVAVGFAVFAK